MTPAQEKIIKSLLLTGHSQKEISELIGIPFYTLVSHLRKDNPITDRRALIDKIVLANQSAFDAMDQKDAALILNMLGASQIQIVKLLHTYKSKIQGYLGKKYNTKRAINSFQLNKYGLDRRYKIPQNLVDQIIELRKVGYSYANISRQTGVSQCSVMRIANPEFAEHRRQYLREYRRKNPLDPAKRRKHTINHLMYKKKVLEDPKK